MENVQPNKTYSLQEILSSNPEWEKAVAKRVWDKHIKSSPLWGKFCNINDRVERLELNLAKIDRKLDEVLIAINNGGERE